MVGTPITAWQTTLAGTADDPAGDGGQLWRGLGGTTLAGRLSWLVPLAQTPRTTTGEETDTIRLQLHTLGCKRTDYACWPLSCTKTFLEALRQGLNKASIPGLLAINYRVCHSAVARRKFPVHDQVRLRSCVRR